MVALVTVLFAASPSASAQVSGIVSGGTRTRGASLEPYVYVELALSDGASVGVDYGRHATGLSFWSGAEGGFYGGAHFTGDSGSLESAELGVWQQYGFGAGSVASGWVGAKSGIGASTPASVSFNAQLRHAMTHPFHALVGIGAVVSNVETDINGWIGIAYQL